MPNTIRTPDSDDRAIAQAMWLATKVPAAKRDLAAKARALLEVHADPAIAKSSTPCVVEPDGTVYCYTE